MNERRGYPRLGSTLAPPVSREVEEELDFHLEMRVRELVARGLAADQARRTALDGFGDLARLRRRCRTIGAGRERRRKGSEMLDGIRQDLAFALRQLRRAPLFALAAVTTLAVGIGATTTLFGILQAVVLRPFPFPHPERLVVVSTLWQGQLGDVSGGNFDAVRRGAPSLAAVTAMQFSSFNLSEDGEPERVVGARATHELFAVFAVAPALGRVFGPDEDRPGGEPVVVLSDRLWRRRFAADPGLVGRTIRLDGEPRTVIGVMPPAFDVTADSEELWVPAAFTPARLAMHDEHFLTVIGRRAEGSDAATLAAELETVAARLRVDHPRENDGRQFEVRSFAEVMIGSYRERLLLLFAAVALVLVIACVNVANLQLARGAARGREIAVRTAIGAGRWRIVRQLVTESALLSLLGGVAGVALARLGLRLLVAAAPAGVPRLEQATVDGPVLAFAVAVALATGTLFGLAPALRLARPDVRDSLVAGGRGVRLGLGRDRLRNGLVVVEVGLAATVLVGGGLLLRTAAHLDRVDPGFRPAGLLTARLSLPASAFAAPQAAEAAFGAIVEELRARPGVVAAAVASQAPLSPGGNSNGLLPEGLPLAVENLIDSRLGIVGEGYFATLEIPLVAGRLLGPEDRRGAAKVMVINETLAKRAFPGEDPVGKRIACCDGTPEVPGWRTVVGVVGDVRSRGPARPPRPDFYLPMAQVPPEAWDWIQRTMLIVARSANDEPASVAPALREAAATVAPGVPLFDVRSMDERKQAIGAPQRFYTWLLAVLGGLGLFLAAVGLYGLVAYFVDERRPEIGVRLALGATRFHVGTLVVGQSLRPVAAGVVLGLLAALAATRALATLLHGVTPTDPATFAAVAALLVAVGVVAAAFPARRAARTDPSRVLGA